MKRSAWSGRDTDGGTLKFLESARSMCNELKLSVVVRANASCGESVVLTTGPSLVPMDASDLDPSFGLQCSYPESLTSVER